MRPEDQNDDSQAEEARKAAHAEWVRVATAGRSGNASIDDIAAAIGKVDSLFAFVPPGEMSRFMQDLGAATEDKGIGNVRVGDAANPRIHGLTLDDGGFLPALFTDDDQAGEFAVTVGFLEPDGAAPFMSKGTASWFWDVLAERHAGVVLDQGSLHELRIDRGSCARIFALLNLENFASWTELWVMHSEGKLALLRNQEQGTLTAAVFSAEKAAAWGVDNSTFPATTTPTMPTLEALQQFLASGVTHLVVDSGFPTQFVYERRDMVRMVDLLGGEAPTTASQPSPTQAPAVGPDPHAAVGTTPASVETSAEDADELPDALRLAMRFPSYAPIEPPGRADGESFEVFRDLRARASDKELDTKIWDYVDNLAYGLDVYVPRHPQRVDGLVWPSFFKHPQQEGQTVSYAFCREATARDMNEAGSMGDQVVHLSGLEALRWIWGAPTPINEMAIDMYQGTAGSLSFPAHFVLSAIWPHFHDVARLDDVAPVSVEKLGRAAAASGSQPQVVRALVRGWDKLVYASSGVGDDAVVEHAGGRYVPVFSSGDAFFAFDSKNPGTLTAASRPEAPPFGDWLDACTALDGVVLDPAGPWPLTVDPTQLAILHRWATHHRRPHGTDLSMEVAQRLHEGTMTETVAGRVLADWPRYFINVQRNADGGICVMTIPDRDCGALFSTYKRAELYLEVYRQAGIIDGSWEPIPMLAHWQRSIFHDLEAHYEEGGWIDPCPPDAGLLVWANNFLGEQEFDVDPTMVMDGHPGVHVHGAMLQSAIERLDEKLKPRVPDFVPAEWRHAA